MKSSSELSVDCSTWCFSVLCRAMLVHFVFAVLCQICLNISPKSSWCASFEADVQEFSSQNDQFDSLTSSFLNQGSPVHYHDMPVPKKRHGPSTAFVAVVAPDSVNNLQLTVADGVHKQATPSVSGKVQTFSG
ncbi:hypothetical protein V6N12_056769 [Hibiscus sabdariffa]|uniref:Uncharacterized protein n=1 Tax=Hibiscus sabdariffa TaxID=183260 RepID=A0ABR2DC12_9ROSI